MRPADDQTGTHKHVTKVKLYCRVEIQRYIVYCNHELVIQCGSGRAGSQIQVQPCTVVTTFH